MPPVASCADARELDCYLRELLPGARLEAAALPLLPELRLWLINADYPVGPLPADVARTLMDAPPYWAFCWGSGAVLARWVLDHPEAVRGRTVLDFGAGSGVVAVAAALAGVSLELSPDYFAFTGGIDLLVAADVLYDRENLPLLAAFRQRAARVLVADSRVRDFAEPGYRRWWSQDCIAVPDLGEAEWVKHVNVYVAGRD
jgi:predicted nicotinamide N-methyase